MSSPLLRVTFSPADGNKVTAVTAPEAFVDFSQKALPVRASSLTVA